MSASFNLQIATRIVDAALACGRGLGLKPLTVAVLDAGGHLVAFQRQDGAGILRPQIAIGKAWGALGMAAGSRQLAERAASHPGFVMALAVASEGRVFPVPGGVLVRDVAGMIVGAVGISGDMPDADERCAVHGVELVELQADTGAAAD